MTTLATNDETSLDFLGDPQYYTKKVMADPPLTPELLAVYKEKAGIDITDADALVDFFNTEKFIEILCEFDFLLFREYILGHVNKDFHIEWYEGIKNNQSVVYLAPRDHGKTHFNRDYVIWNAYYRKVRGIHMISDTLPQAQELFISGEDAIKEQIEYNEKLQHLKPVGSAGKWSERTLQLSNGVRITVSGYGSRIRGKHPDLLIMDDVLSDQNCITKELRDKTWRYYTRTIHPMTKKRTKILIMGTAQHPDDLLHKLSKLESVFFKKYQALINEETKEVLWPERRSFEQLMTFRRDYGVLAFEQEYQNNPMADNLSYFPEDIVTACFNRELSYLSRYHGENRTFLGGDLSPPGGAKERDGDYTVFSALEKFPSNKLRLLNFDRFRDDPDSKELFLQKQLDALSAMCFLFQVDSGFIEEIGFQAIYTKDFIKRTTDLPIKGYHVSGTGKRSLESGLPFLRGLMEKQMIEFPYKTEEDQAKTNLILREFHGIVRMEDGRFGNMAFHDDIPTSIWMAVEASKEQLSGFFTRPSAGGKKRGFMGPRKGFMRSRRGV